MTRQLEATVRARPSGVDQSWRWHGTAPGAAFGHRLIFTEAMEAGA